VIIVGAGPAGLAVGACLRRARVPFSILDQGDRPGVAWHRHYDRLHLHTAKAFSALPYLPFPDDVPRYPSRDQVVKYLHEYAAHFDLQPEFGQQVMAARPDGDEWQIKTQNRFYRARNLVIATGYNREPNVPSWPGQRLFRGAVIHSAHYRNGQPFKGQRVLVVGFGNSGGEIAIDLWEHGAQPGLSIRGPVNVVPRELFGIPILAIAIALSRLPPRLADAINAPILRRALGDLRPYGLAQRPDGPLTQIRRHAHIPLIDVGTIDLIKRGAVTVHPGLERFTDDGVVFADGSQVAFETVILATGFRPRANAFLAGAAAVCDPDGTPLTSGRQTAIPGLYFCGFNVAATGMLREIGLEARRIAASIARAPG
jgi:cation diffusion facilitator CzcD-associated flavoprotein CzcO